MPCKHGMRYQKISGGDDNASNHDREAKPVD